MQDLFSKHTELKPRSQTNFASAHGVCPQVLRSLNSGGVLQPSSEFCGFQVSVTF